MACHETTPMLYSNVYNSINDTIGNKKAGNDKRKLQMAGVANTALNRLTKEVKKPAPDLMNLYSQP